MALSSILVDRARVVRHEPLAQKVDGRTIFDWVASSDWFRTRLTFTAKPNSQTTADGQDAVGGGRHRTVDNARLFIRYSVALALPAQGDRVEVQSEQYGSALWEVMEEPMPIRKRRRLVGYRVQVHRVEERAFAA